MAFQIVGNWRTLSGVIDDEGNRTYRIKFLLQTAFPGLDGPTVAMQTIGLPQFGDVWFFGTDLDVWAFCKRGAEFAPLNTSEDAGKQEFYIAEYTFSTKNDTKRCKDQQIEDPLLVPNDVSGSFQKYQEEATQDRFGNMLISSSFEQIRGPQVEFDANRPSVKVSQNVPILGLSVFGPMIDTLNDSPQWGLPPRCIKLSSVSWEKKYYGLCYAYFTRTLEFDINVKYNRASGEAVSGYDRDVLDEGAKALQGHWNATTGNYILEKIGGQTPNPNNPQHYKLFTDRDSNPCRTILNGAGLPSGATIDGVATTIVNNFNITASDNFTQTIANQPPPVLDRYGNPTIQGLSIRLDDDDYRLNTFNVVIVGKDDHNTVINEVVQLGGYGTGNFPTTRKYAEITSIKYEVDIISGGTAAVDIITNQFVFNPGFRHVEKYNESNFFLLGIPVVLEV